MGLWKHSWLTLCKEGTIACHAGSFHFRRCKHFGWKLLCLCYERQEKSVRASPSKYSSHLLAPLLIFMASNRLSCACLCTTLCTVLLRPRHWFLLWHRVHLAWWLAGGERFRGPAGRWADVLVCSSRFSLSRRPGILFSPACALSPSIHHIPFPLCCFPTCLLLSCLPPYLPPSLPLPSSSRPAQICSAAPSDLNLCSPYSHPSLCCGEGFFFYHLLPVRA